MLRLAIVKASVPAAALRGHLPPAPTGPIFQSTFVSVPSVRVLTPGGVQWGCGGSGSRQRAGMSSAATGFKSISVADASVAVSTGTRYLDVRTVEEYDAGHVPGAVDVPNFNKSGGALVPNPAFLEQVESQLPDKSESLVVGCKSGKRSEMACQLMSQAGYSNLMNMEGGFDAWRAAKYPVEKMAARYESIDVEAAQECTTRGKYAFVDVRTPEEFVAGHPPGAVNIPVALQTPDGRQANPDFLGQVAEHFPDKATPLCVACGGGTRGTSAAERLVDEGYQQVVCMPGGMKAWKARGLPITPAPGSGHL